MNDEQHASDLEKAREKLKAAQETKEARRDPRAEVLTPGSLALGQSDKAGTDAKTIKPVAAKPKKKKFGQKLKEAVFSEDIGNGSVTEYAFFKIVIPALKRLASDTLNSMINMALGLDPRTRTVSSGNTHTANASIYRDRNYNRPSDNYTNNRRDAVSEYRWDEETANDIYSQVRDQIEAYGEISLELVYSIMNMGELIRTTDRHWGWTRSSLPDIQVVPVDATRSEWIVDFPSARPLNR